MVQNLWWLIPLPLPQILRLSPPMLSWYNAIRDIVHWWCDFRWHCFCPSFFLCQIRDVSAQTALNWFVFFQGSKTLLIVISFQTMTTMMRRGIPTARAIQQALRAIQSGGVSVHPSISASGVLHCPSQSFSRHRHGLSSLACRSSVFRLSQSATSEHMQHRKTMSTDTARSGNLMDFPHILFPSFIKMAKNMFFTWFIIRPYLDPNFSFKTFMDGAKQVRYSTHARIELFSVKMLHEILLKIILILSSHCISCIFIFFFTNFG